MTIQIGQPNPDDYEQMAALYRDTFFNEYTEFERSVFITPEKIAAMAKSGVFIVAKHGAQVVGVQLYARYGSPAAPHARPREIQPQWFAVHPDWEGQGIATQILSAALTALRNVRIYKRMIVIINKDRADLEKLFVRSGAIRTPARDSKFNKNEVIAFEIDLKHG